MTKTAQALSLFAPETALATEAPAPAVKPLKVKHVMLVDSGDGSFTDDSVKIKPHNEDPSKVVFKCVDAARLMKTLVESGLVATAFIKGSKHYIASVDAQAVQSSLQAGKAAPALQGASAKLLK